MVLLELDGGEALAEPSRPVGIQSRHVQLFDKRV
jgi:hypothetical protein